MKGLAAHTSTPDLNDLPRAEQAYRKLRDAILRGTLKPGERLLEVKLASLLGVSRTPVHEALSRLEIEGLAAKDPARGLVVVELDASMIAELYAVREALEGTAAALAARHASEGEVITLRQIVNRDQEFVGEPERLAANNRLFHDTLYRCAHNRYLLKTLKALNESIALLRTSLAYSKTGVHTTVEQHQQIVDAIEARDSRKAEELARAHVQAAGKARLALLFGAGSER